MRRRSSTWLFSVGLALLATATPVAATSRLCLPPIFDGGRRLHPLPSPRVQWLQLLLRQHELCWRRPTQPDELRVVLGGNSAMFGFPLPVEETFADVLNRDFAAQGVPAHVYNLGYVNTYQLKDAVILHESLAYAPDVILYPITLAEFVHAAPIVWPSLIQFFASNSGALATILGESPAGLGEPFEAYRSVAERELPEESRFARFQEAGLMLRIAASRNADWLADRLGARVPRLPVRTTGRQLSYDCAATHRDFTWQYDDWSTWNILAYLEQLEREHGVEVIVVNWPVAHEPVDDCYNVRYPAADFARYDDFLRDETAKRGLRYIDLHDMLPSDAFLDSLHVSAEGHRQIAERLDTILAPEFRELARRKRAP